MSTDVWFRSDIHHALQAAAAAGQETAMVARDDNYLRGYAAALRMLALTFGLNPIEIVPERTERKYR